jgi:hypothetical protein
MLMFMPMESRRAPHAVRKVRVRTIPLSGSNYPAMLTMKT